MDSLSYRKSRPNHEEQPESIADNLSFETPKDVPPAPVRRETAHRSGSSKKASSNNYGKLATLLVGALAVLGLAWWLLGGGSGTGAPLIQGDKFQAVFLTNGQVYFGKLTQQNSSYMKITNVFYLQRKTTTTDDKTNPQNAAAQTANDVELIKLGNEIHGPDDTMIIPRDQILFYENLKSDGNVSKTITQYQQTQKK